MSGGLKLLIPSEVEPKHHRWLDFDRQRAFGPGNQLHILATCPICNDEHWKLCSNFRKNAGYTPKCKKCWRRKPLVPSEVSPEYRQWYDFDSQTSIRMKSGKCTLHIQVVCPHCRKERWRICTMVRRQNDSPYCQGCSYHLGNGQDRWLREGYVMLSILGLPFADRELARAMARNNFIAEHRLIMAKHVGRSLRSKEVVHHRNGDKADNRLANLRLVHRDNHSNAPGDDIAAAVVEIEAVARQLDAMGVGPLPLLQTLTETARMELASMELASHD